MSSTGATYNAGARLEAAKAADRTLDLLAIPLVRKIFLSRYLLPALQVCCLVLFGLVIYDGFLGVQAQEKNFALSNLSLSLLFFIFVLWIRRPILGISSSPVFTAWFVIAWALVAIVLGLLFARRAFCQFVCPISAPLSVIARVAPVELRAASGGRMNPICRRCSSRACYNGSAIVGGCPMGEFPAAMESNANCIFCLDCLKSCPERSPLQIRLRWPFAELTQVKRPPLLDSLTVIVLSGIFLYPYGYRPRATYAAHIPHLEPRRPRCGP